MRILLFILLFNTLHSQTESSFFITSGLTKGSKVDLCYSAGLSFRDAGEIVNFRLEFSAKYFDSRLAVQNKFGIEAGSLYPFFFFELIPKSENDRIKMTDISNNVGIGIIYKLPLINRDVLQFEISQSLFQYKPGSKIQFIGIGIIKDL